MDLSLLNDNEITDLFEEIKSYENKLKELVEENNILESQSILNYYKYLNQDKPRRLQNLLTNIEHSIYNSNTDCNPEYALQLTSDFTERANQLEIETQMINEECEEKRQELLNILKEINEISEEPDINQIQTPSFDSRCSEEVEKLSREFSNLINDVNEEDLVSFLARGGSNSDDIDIIEKVKTLAKIRYQTRCAIIINEALSSTNEQLYSQDFQDLSSISNGVDNLTQTFENLTNELKNLSKCEIPEIDDSIISNTIKKIEESTSILLPLRSKLQNALYSDSIIPPGIGNSEKEKETLNECIKVLKESISNIYNYLI